MNLVSAPCSDLLLGCLESQLLHDTMWISFRYRAPRGLALNATVEQFLASLEEALSPTRSTMQRSAPAVNYLIFAGNFFVAQSSVRRPSLFIIFYDTNLFCFNPSSQRCTTIELKNEQSSDFLDTPDFHAALELPQKSGICGFTTLHLSFYTDYGTTDYVRYAQQTVLESY